MSVPEAKHPLGHPDDYCGFSCTDKLDELQAICDEVIDFSKYNPEFAPVMLDKLAAVINETRGKLHEQKDKAQV
jgi:hypothetical protein